MKRLRLLLARLAAQPKSWFRAITHRSRLESDMEAELANHLELLTADLIRAGHTPAEAHRNARLSLGSAVATKDGMRQSLGLRLWDDLAADLRYGARILLRSPGFTSIAVLSLALAIGANTTIFSLAKQLLYDRLAVPNPGDLRMLHWVGDGKEVISSMWGDFDAGPKGTTNSSVFSYPVYLQLRGANQSLQDLLAFKEESMNATVRDNAKRVNAAMVSGNYFAVLQVPAQFGRTLQPADDAQQGQGAVAVISDGLWQRDFDRSPNVLGQTLKLNQTIVTIVGVAPRRFTGAKNVQSSPDIFIPLSLQPVVLPKGANQSLLDDTGMWWLNVEGRLKPGVSDQQAQSALDVQLAAAIRATMSPKSDQTLPRLVLEEGSRGLHFTDGTFRKPIYVLITFTGLVLLLACANVANLLLARGAQRQREMSVRLAMGAGRARIVRQLLTESLMMAALGGSGGLMLAYLGRNVLPSLLTNAWDDKSLQVPFDWGVFAFTAALTVLTGILFGLAPAWIIGRTDAGRTLQETSKTSSRRRKGLTGRSIVIFQISLSTLLVVGAGLFLRTVVALNSVDVGFQPDHLLLFDVSPPAKRYPAGQDVLLHARIERAIAAIPGVEHVSPGWVPYMASSMSNETFDPEGEPRRPKSAEDVNAVGNDFFATMHIPMVAGRDFGPQDTTTSAKVAIINQSLARARFPHANPIGKRFQTDERVNAPWITIIGICADTRYMNLRDEPPPQFFLPFIQQKEIGTMVYQVRSQLPVDSLIPSLRRTVAAIDPDLPLVDIRTQQQQIDANMQIERTFAALTSGFGLLALSLACVGIYGVMAYSVANRTNEIGIRLALGAVRGQVLGMILRESTWLSLAGVAVGLAAALFLAGLVKSMLYGLQPYDPVSLIFGAILILAVGLIASWIPARRAAGIQPMAALRHE